MIGRILCFLGLHKTPNRIYRHAYYWEAMCKRCHEFICNGRKVTEYKRAQAGEQKGTR